MIDKIEVFTSTKHLASRSTFDYILDTVLVNGFKSIALHGCFLESLSKTKIKPHASLTIEYPFCQNDSVVRAAMIEAYIGLYGDLFDTINISPQAMNLAEDNLFDNLHDLNTISEICIQCKKKLRIIIDLSCFEDADFLSKFIDNIQVVADSFIFGASISKEKDLLAILQVYQHLIPSLNLPVSFLGKLSSWDDMASLQPYDFESILIPHNNLINLLKK